MALPFSKIQAEPYENLDLNQITGFSMKQAMNRLDLMPNFETARQYLNLSYSNIAHSVNQMFKNNVPESYDYLISYCMGMMKNVVFYPTFPI